MTNKMNLKSLKSDHWLPKRCDICECQNWWNFSKLKFFGRS